jgi:transcriptional regulator with XRE-family HTH domain
MKGQTLTTTGACAMTEQPDTEPLTLADLRRKAQVKQSDIARAMGLTAGQVSRIEADFPEVAFPKVQAYLKALGGHIIFTEWDLGDVWADRVIADPDRQDARERRKQDRHRDPTRRSSDKHSAPEELVLQGQTPETSGDPSGRDVDQPDPERHQDDEGHRQQP